MPPTDPYATKFQKRIDALFCLFTILVITFFLLDSAHGQGLSPGIVASAPRPFWSTFSFFHAAPNVSLALAAPKILASGEPDYAALNGVDLSALAGLAEDSKSEFAPTMAISGKAGTQVVPVVAESAHADESSAPSSLRLTNWSNGVGVAGTTPDSDAGSANQGASITGATNGTVGTLTLMSSATFAGASGSLATFVVDLMGATSDRLAISGVLDLSNLFDSFSFNGSADATTTYALATFSSVTGIFDDVVNLPSGYALFYNANNLQLSPLTPVPEPGTWLAGALALLALSRVRRRKHAALSPTLLALPLICAISLSSGARAATVIDPDPERSSMEFGHAIVSMGDVTGDGVPDLAVGAPFQDGDFGSTTAGYGNPQNVGKVYLVDGATFAIFNQLTDPEFDLVQDQHFGGQIGTSLAAVGDLDGDGVTDIIAGVPHHIGDPDEKEEILCGKALVFSGKTGALLFTLEDPAEEENGRFGAAVAALGDVDDDGVPDLLVGVPGKDIGGEDGVPNVGLAYVFSGATGQLVRTLNHPDRGGAEAGAGFGSALANAGDVDHDGVSDMVIGAPGEGHVFVFSGATGAQIFDISSPIADAIPSFGSAVDGGKDFNRDGTPDFVIGAPLSKGLRGAAYILSGKSGSPLRKLKPAVTQTFARFGASVFASNDVTGDGQPDVIVGAPDQNVNGMSHAGEVFVINGRNGGVFQSLISSSPASGARFGSALSSADFDGDGKGTAIVGAPDQTINLDDGTGNVITHVQMGQIEIEQ